MTNREKIRTSLDARCLRRSLKAEIYVYIGLVVFISLIAIIAFWKFPTEMVKALTVYNLLYTVFYAPMILFHAVRLRNLLKRSDDYVYGRATLSEFHTAWRGHFYFCVEFSDERGQRYRGETASFFHASAFALADFEEWHGKSVELAFDPETERMIVLCKVSS